MKIYVQSPDYGSAVAHIFQREGHTIVDNVPDCDVYVLTGGEDINPLLYGEEPIAATYYNQRRDDQELRGYRIAHELNKFKFGICRGAQLLTALNGGKLWQDVDGHTRAHNMFDVRDRRIIHTSSVHHQQMRVPEGKLPDGTPICEVICVADESHRKQGLYDFWQADGESVDQDVEVCWYPGDRGLCVQGHPEYGGYGDLKRYMFDLMYERIAA